jgi:hypothetical protein
VLKGGSIARDDAAFRVEAPEGFKTWGIESKELGPLWGLQHSTFTPLHLEAFWHYQLLDMLDDESIHLFFTKGTHIH